MSWYRNPLFPVGIAVILSLIVLVNFFYPGTVVDEASATLMDWAVIIGQTMVWVGVINVARHATREATTKRPGRWHLAIFQLFIIAAMFISGFGEGARSVARGTQSVINWLYANAQIYGGLGSSALMGFWAVTASYRAFRARTWESFFFLLGAFLVLLRNAPIGGVIWSGFPIIGDWIMSTPYTAMQRALTIGTGIAVVGYALRYYLGKERGAFGTVE
jgi:hypothetical protein